MYLFWIHTSHAACKGRHVFKVFLWMQRKVIFTIYLIAFHSIMICYALLSDTERNNNNNVYLILNTKDSWKNFYIANKLQLCPSWQVHCSNWKRAFRPFTIYNGAILLRVDLGSQKQTKNNQHWQHILNKSNIDIYHSAKFWFYL